MCRSLLPLPAHCHLLSCHLASPRLARLPNPHFRPTRLWSWPRRRFAAPFLLVVSPAAAWPSLAVFSLSLVPSTSSSSSLTRHGVQEVFLPGGTLQAVSSNVLWVVNPGSALRDILLKRGEAPPGSSRFGQQGPNRRMSVNLQCCDSPFPGCRLAPPSWQPSTTFQMAIATSPFWLLIMAFAPKGPCRNSSAPGRVCLHRRTHACLFFHICVTVQPFGTRGFDRTQSQLIERTKFH